LHFEPRSAYLQLCNHFKTQDLKSFGCDLAKAAIGAAAAVLYYAKQMQHSELQHIQTLQTLQPNEHLILDYTTNRNLELTTSLNQDQDHSLISILDKTNTPMGKRLLRQWMMTPSRDLTTIHSRQNSVAQLLHNYRFESITPLLRQIDDIERITTRVLLGKARPRDLTRLAHTLAVIPELKHQLESDPELIVIANWLEPLEPIQTYIQSAIKEEPSLLIKDGQVIADGFDVELDELRQLHDNGTDFLVQLEEQEREATQLSSLKVKYNRVFGYSIEISKSQADKAPAHYTRRQTLKNAERFIIPELKEHENKVLGAQAKALVREKYLFEKIIERLCEYAEPLQRNARCIGYLDVCCSFAQTADQYSWCRPDVNIGSTLSIEDGRHPVVEAISSHTFTPNSIALQQLETQALPRMLLITGPNMGGKSTYMRQTAIIVLMAHMGCFVPATSAQIPILDRIFTRIGSADNLAGGQSTFMVEMSETANILRHATGSSLVLLDEIGRGTSTYDGLAIAFAAAEHLVDYCQSFCLFATHYFELTKLPSLKPKMKNAHFNAVEQNQSIAFRHQIAEGPANKSYGIAVAQLAGVPRTVILRAQQILLGLEQDNVEKKIKTQPLQVDFLTVMEEQNQQAASKLLEDLEKAALDEFSPRQALDLLYAWKQHYTNEICRD